VAANPVEKGIQHHIRLNTVERGYEAKVYKFNNRKDDALFK
jgi:hypothetical protein